MRKSIVSPAAAPGSPIHEAWRDIVRIPRVEMTSEDEAIPIDQALGKIASTGWRAAAPGPQVIRLHFDEPLTIRRIQVHFVEPATERSQEIAIFVNDGSAPTLREVARQQWNFSPAGATEEIEDYPVSLTGITVLELRIDPDRSHDPAQSQSYATLASLKIA